jgi:hypothetical protein
MLTPGSVTSLSADLIRALSELRICLRSKLALTAIQNYFSDVDVLFLERGIGVPCAGDREHFS